MKEKIQSLIDKRESILQEHYDSWDEDKEDYAIEWPEQIDILAKEISDAISAGRDSLDCDFILESYTMLGLAPQLIYDDNGHWAVTDDGYSSVPMTEDGKFDGPESFVAIAHPEQWKDTIREALYHYIDN